MADVTMKETKATLHYSLSNSITFDGWSSKNGAPYLGIKVKALID